MQVLLQFVVLKELHHALSIYCFGLVERNEGEIFRWLCDVVKGAFDGVQVMGAD